MNATKHIKSERASLILSAALLAALATSGGTAQGQGVSIQVSTPVVAPVVVVADDYVYYPKYGVYYNRSRHQYAYLRHNDWVTAAAPEGVTAEVLLASPSVHMDFHDSPAHHHDDIMKKYPRNWAAPGDHRDDHDRK